MHPFLERYLHFPFCIVKLIFCNSPSSLHLWFIPPFLGGLCGLDSIVFSRRKRIFKRTRTRPTTYKDSIFCRGLHANDLNVSVSSIGAIPKLLHPTLPVCLPSLARNRIWSENEGAYIFSVGKRVECTELGSWILGRGWNLLVKIWKSFPFLGLCYSHMYLCFGVESLT